MVAFEMMMIGMILMSQTAFQCLSGSGINKEKRKQDGGDFSHGKSFLLRPKRQCCPIVFSNAAISFPYGNLTKTELPALLEFIRRSGQMPNVGKSTL
jgi:hypothetical protein